MPISSSDDTQVVAQVRLGKLVTYRAKVTVRPDPCGSFQKVSVCGCDVMSRCLAQDASAKERAVIRTIFFLQIETRLMNPADSQFFVTWSFVNSSNFEDRYANGFPLPHHFSFVSVPKNPLLAASIFEITDRSF